MALPAGLLEVGKQGAEPSSGPDYRKLGNAEVCAAVRNETEAQCTRGHVKFEGEGRPWKTIEWELLPARSTGGNPAPVGG